MAAVKISEGAHAMTRVETADRLTANRVWASLDAAGYRATLPLPTLGLGAWSVVVEGPGVTPDVVRRALPKILRSCCIFSELAS